MDGTSSWTSACCRQKESEQAGVAAGRADWQGGGLGQSDGTIREERTYGDDRKRHQSASRRRWTPVACEIDALWRGLGLGGTYAWADDKYALYARRWRKSSFEDFGDSYAISGTVGFKATW
jgi:hypothetical protein